MKKVYWVQYYALVNRLCKFLLANRAKLPLELRGDAATLFTLVETLCVVLQAYDETNARGRATGI